MRGPVNEEREVVAFKMEGVTITVTQRVAAGVVETPLGGYLFGTIRPLSVSVETPDRRIVHTLLAPEIEASEAAS